MKPTVLAAASGLAVAAIASAQTAEWANPVTGNWGVLANWDTLNVPDTAAESALIGVAGNYSVILAALSPSIDDLTISNADATLSIQTARTLTVNGDTLNNGLIEVNPLNGGAATTLRMGDGSVLSGSGVVRLSGFSTRSQISSVGALPFTQLAGHEIRGFGRVISPMINQGLISADFGGQVLEISGSDKSSTGVLEATIQGQLTVNGIVLDQTGGGQLTADQLGLLTISSSNVIAGSIDQVGTGIVNIQGAGTYENVSMSGTVNLLTAGTMRLDTTLTNNGTLSVNPTNGGAATTVRLDSNVVFGGTGDIRLSGFSTRAQITSDMAGFVGTNSAGHTIQGFGRITASLINDGLIAADNNGNSLTIQTNPQVNNAIMRARDGGLLIISGVGVDQSGGGMIEAVVNGDVDLVNSTVTGGTLIRGGSGIFTSSGTTTLDGVTVTGGFDIPTAGTTTVLSGILNNGVIRVNPTNGGAQTNLRFDESGTLGGSGEVVLSGFGTRAQLASLDSSTVVTQGPNHEIRGFGRITAPLVNEGLVTSDEAGQNLELVQDDKVNNSVMRATGTGVLTSNAVTIDQTGEGTIAALDGSLVRLTNSAVVGGLLLRDAGAAFECTGAMLLRGVAVTGGFDAPAGSTITIEDGIANNGTIVVNPTNGGAVTVLNFDGDQTIEGNGEVVLSGFTTRAQLTSPANASVATNGPMHAIRGFGQISTAMVNEGLITADQPGQTLLVNGANKTNDSVMRAENGGIMNLNGIALDQTGGGTLLADGGEVDLTNSSIAGGNVNSSNGGTVEFAGTGSLDGVSMDADASITPASAYTVSSAGLTNDGTLVVNPTNGAAVTDLRVENGATLGGSGSVLLGGGFNRSRVAPAMPGDSFTNGAGHTVGGIGQITATMLNDGILAPGLSTGEIDIDAGLVSGSTAQIQIELAGDNDTDFIDAGGAVVLGGNIDVRLIDGYVPAGRTVYTVMQADGGITGEFSSITGDDVGNGLVLKWATDGNELQVAYTCPGDVGFPLGTADIDDVLAFLDAFANQGAIADLAPPQGVFNIDDVLAFLDAFAQGCP